MTKYVIPAKRINTTNTVNNMETRMALIARKVLLSTAEKKIKIVANAVANTSTTGTVINISNNVVEGDDIFDRSGTKITVTESMIRYRAIAVASSQTTRFILFRDVMNQGTTPTVSDVLPNVSVIGNFSDTRYYQQKRFHIINDWIVDVNINGEAIKTQTFINKNVGAVLYNGPTNVAASNGKGAIFLLVIGSAATGFYEYNSTLLFNDS